MLVFCLSLSILDNIVSILGCHIEMGHICFSFHLSAKSCTLSLSLSLVPYHFLRSSLCSPLLNHPCNRASELVPVCVLIKMHMLRSMFLCCFSHSFAHFGQFSGVRQSILKSLEIRYTYDKAFGKFYLRHSTGFTHIHLRSYHTFITLTAFLQLIVVYCFFLCLLYLFSSSVPSSLYLSFSPIHNAFSFKEIRREEE